MHAPIENNRAASVGKDEKTFEATPSSTQLLAQPPWKYRGDKKHKGLERRKIERVATVLGLENTKEQTVRNEQHTTPNEDSQLLSVDILHAWNLQRKCDSGKGENGIYGMLEL